MEVVTIQSQNTWEYFWFPLLLYALCVLYRLWHIMYQVIALLETLELQESAKRKGHFSLFNCLVLGHTKYKGVQRVYCNPFPSKMFYGSHRMDPVMIRPPGIDNGAFVVSPDTVWYARVLLLFSASAMTDTGSKSFDCALVSTLETYDDPDNGNYFHYAHYCNYCHYLHLFALWQLCILYQLLLNDYCL